MTDKEESDKLLERLNQDGLVHVALGVNLHSQANPTYNHHHNGTQRIHHNP